MDKKDETKAFWEGKMQSEFEDQQVVPSRKSKADQQQLLLTRQHQTLSPPPGWDNNDFFGQEQDDHVDDEDERAQLNDEPTLSDEFTDVASITFKSDDSSLESKSAGHSENGHADEDELDSAPLTNSVAVQVEKPSRPAAYESTRHTPAYFAPDRGCSSSDDEEEVDSRAGKGGYFSNNQSNPTETLIEREIRLQREREEAVERERQEALQILEATRRQQQQPTPQQREVQTKAPDAAARKSYTVESNKKEAYNKQVIQSSAEFTKKVTAPEPIKKTASDIAVTPAEIRISEEIRELKQREEELRLLREANARNQNVNDDPSSYTASGVTDDEGLYSDVDRDVSSSEANSRFVLRNPISS